MSRRLQAAKCQHNLQMIITHTEDRQQRLSCWAGTITIKTVTNSDASKCFRKAVIVFY